MWREKLSQVNWNKFSGYTSTSLIKSRVGKELMHWMLTCSMVKNSHTSFEEPAICKAHQIALILLEKYGDILSLTPNVHKDYYCQQSQTWRVTRIHGTRVILPQLRELCHVLPMSLVTWPLLSHKEVLFSCWINGHTQCAIKHSRANHRQEQYGYITVTSHALKLNIQD